jgi:hypothetical protein
MLSRAQLFVGKGDTMRVHVRWEQRAKGRWGGLEVSRIVGYEGKGKGRKQHGKGNDADPRGEFGGFGAYGGKQQLNKQRASQGGEQKGKEGRDQQKEGAASGNPPDLPPVARDEQGKELPSLDEMRNTAVTQMRQQLALQQTEMEGMGRRLQRQEKVREVENERQRADRNEAESKERGKLGKEIKSWEEKVALMMAEDKRKQEWIERMEVKMKDHEDMLEENEKLREGLVSCEGTPAAKRVRTEEGEATWKDAATWTGEDGYAGESS